MVWLPDGEKKWKYIYSFWQNARTWRTHTDTQTHTHTAWRHRPRLHSITRQTFLTSMTHCHLKLVHSGALFLVPTNKWNKFFRSASVSRTSSGKLGRYVHPFRGVYSDTTQLNSTDPVEQRTAKSVVSLFMTSRPTNRVNCCSRCRVEFSWVELCRYKRAFSRRPSVRY